MSFTDRLVYIIPVIVIALSVHEWAHAWAAYKFGDTTAQRAGRLTLNPMAHIDPIGILPILFNVLVGWAKPVPVNPYAVRNPRIGLPMIAAAGPISNIIQMFLGLLLWFLYSSFLASSLGRAANDLIGTWIFYFVYINFILAFFNLVPIAPLDGSKVLSFFLPDDMADRYDTFINRLGMTPLIVLIVLNMATGGKLLIAWFGFWFPLVRWAFNLAGFPSVGL